MHDIHIIQMEILFLIWSNQNFWNFMKPPTRKSDNYDFEISI